MDAKMFPDGLKVAIDLYKNSISSVGSLWGLYSAATLALLGYILGGKNPLPGRGKIGLGAAFLVFAISNAITLYQAQCVGYAATLSMADYCHHSNFDATSEDLNELGHLTLDRPQVVVVSVGFYSKCTAGNLRPAPLRAAVKQPTRSVD